LTKTIEEYEDFAELVEDQYLKPLKVGDPLKAALAKGC
jgi:hypothetical protein